MSNTCLSENFSLLVSDDAVVFAENSCLLWKNSRVLKFRDEIWRVTESILTL